MNDLVYITGSQYKASLLKELLDIDFEHHDIDLDEIQSLDLREVVKHKAKQAFEIVKRPVFVEDTSLEFCAFGRLPGPFIKFFCQELSNEQLCKMVKDLDRSAIARCMFGFYDGNKLEFIEGSINGLIADKPAGNGGFGWDKIFIADGNSVTNAELTPDQYQLMYTSLKPIEKLKIFLETR